MMLQGLDVQRWQQCRVLQQTAALVCRHFNSAGQWPNAYMQALYRLLQSAGVIFEPSIHGLCKNLCQQPNTCNFLPQVDVCRLLARGTCMLGSHMRGGRAQSHDATAATACTTNSTSILPAAQTMLDCVMQHTCGVQAALCLVPLHAQHPCPRQ